MIESASYRYPKYKDTTYKNLDSSQQDPIGDTIDRHTRHYYSDISKQNVQENTTHGKYQAKTKNSKLRNEMGDYRADELQNGEQAIIMNHSSSVDRDHNPHSYESYSTQHKSNTIDEMNSYHYSKKLTNQINNYNNKLNQAISSVTDKCKYLPKHKEPTEIYQNKVPNAQMDYYREFERNYNLNDRKLPQSANPGIYDFDMDAKEKVQILLNQVRPKNFDPLSFDKMQRERERKQKIEKIIDDRFNERHNSLHLNPPSTSNFSNNLSIDDNNNVSNKNESIQKLCKKRLDSKSRSTSEYFGVNNLIQREIQDDDLSNELKLEYENNDFCKSSCNDYDAKDDDSINHKTFNNSRTSNKTVIEMESVSRSNRSGATSKRSTTLHLLNLENSKLMALKEIKSGIDKINKIDKLNSERYEICNAQKTDKNLKYDERNDQYIFSSYLYKQNQQKEREHHYVTIKREIARLEEMEKETFLKKI